MKAVNLILIITFDPSFRSGQALDTSEFQYSSSQGRPTFFSRIYLGRQPALGASVSNASACQDRQNNRCQAGEIPVEKTIKRPPRGLELIPQARARSRSHTPSSSAAPPAFQDTPTPLGSPNQELLRPKYQAQLTALPAR